MNFDVLEFDGTIAPSLAPDQWGPKGAPVTTGLTYGYIGGTAISSSGVTTLAVDGSVALTNNATNYVERDYDGTVHANTVAFTAARIPMAVVTTVGGAITAYQDWRPHQGAFPYFPPLASEVGVKDVRYRYGNPNRYGAVGDGVADDTTALNNAWASLNGGRSECPAGAIYKITSVLTPPTSGIVDLTGATIKPVGNIQAILKNPPAVTITQPITSGYSLGSDTLLLANTTGLAAGQLCTIATTGSLVNGNLWPLSWVKIKSVVVNTSVTLESPLLVTYDGSPVLSVRSVAGSLEIKGGTLDASLCTYGTDFLVKLGGYDNCVVDGLKCLTASGVAVINSLVGIQFCDRGVIQNCRAINHVLTAQAFQVGYSRSARIEGCEVDGDSFAIGTIQCDTDVITKNTVRGRRHNSGTANSTRGLKSNGNRHTIITENHGSDFETFIEYSSSGRGVIAKNVGQNMGLFPYAGQCAITVGCITPANEQFGVDLDGNILENCGGFGISISNDVQGRVQIRGGYLRKIARSAIILAVQNVGVHGVTIEDFNTDGTAGEAAIRSSGTAGAITIDGVTFINVNNTRNCMNLAAGPTYNVRANVAVSGNPLYDTANGINPGATNMFNGSVAGVRKDGSVTVVPHVGTQENTFVVPNTKTFSFTVGGFAKLFTISDVSGGQGALVFCDQESATVALLSNPGAIFVASSAPGGGLIGIFKSAASDVVSVKNNTGASVSISVCVVGAAVTFTTDPA